MLIIIIIGIAFAALVYLLGGERMDKLKPCPFCGSILSEPQTVNYYIEPEYYCAVVCSECRLEMLSDEWADEQSAEAEVIAKWNTRYEPTNKDVK